MMVDGVEKSCKHIERSTEPLHTQANVNASQGWGSPTYLAQVPAHFTCRVALCNKRSGVDGDMRLGVRGKVAAFIATFRIWPHLFSIFAEMSFTIFTCFSHSNIAVFTLPSSYGKAVSSLTETMSISSSSSSSSCPCSAVCGPER